ncbi:alpha-crystallin A chain-like [Oratosquilla oratoria]|uniref:alpha-crystallin A chain-like n=1 Tax=Oratosquilla oratoria TaxID=337810 RepID=UPI003F76E45D
MSRHIPLTYRDQLLRDMFSDRDFWGDRERDRDRFRADFADRPSKLFDQHFASTLAAEDMTAPSSSLYYRGRRVPRDKSGVSHLGTEKDKFTVCLDVPQFTPDNLKVRVVENNVVEVEGKHDERQDEHGSISRQFLRKYKLPDDVIIEMVNSTLSPDGVLIIDAPRKPPEPPKPSERDVPIRKTEKSAKD